MSILQRPHRQTKPARNTRKPVAEFAAGLEVVASPLPAIDGAGLSTQEHFRISRARNLATSVYAADVPDAGPEELARVGRAAAADALRTLLRDRPAAPCCDPAEALPCQGCLEVAAVGEVDPNDVECDPSEWPAWTDGERWVPSDDSNGRVTLPELLDLQAERFRGFGNRTGDMLARTLAELADAARSLHAETPFDLEARMHEMERDDLARVWEPELLASGRWA